MKNDRVLFVDDDQNILHSFKRQLKEKFDIHTAQNGKEAIHTLTTHAPFAVVISDMQMPEMNGLELLKEVAQHSPTTIRIMLTGNVDQNTAVHAVNDGHVFRFINKPCSIEELSKAVNAGMQQYKIVQAEKDLLQNTLTGIVRLLTDILSTIDPDSFDDGVAMRQVAKEVYHKLAVTNLWELDLAIMLRRIGSITLPLQIAEKFRKGAALDRPELALVQQLPMLSNQLLGQIPRLENVANIVYYSEKGFDGTGYPNDSKRGSEIPIESRLIRILNDLIVGVDKSGSIIDMLNKMLKLKDYDPKIVEILLSHYLLKEKADSKKENNVFEIKASELYPGHIILKNICSTDDLLIAAAGHVVTELSLKRIRNYAEFRGLKDPILVSSRIPTESK